MVRNGGSKIGEEAVEGEGECWGRGGETGKEGGGEAASERFETEL